ncbi:uncharacterized protein FSUBG_3061 [Fusarium subglutinans]|uniref:Uncharacterized protein n=1 Tax=Gibberella subglutinans TaxID=42677 RepID=A0A8H5V6E2_GIBSU|nr:uncharacterized protein FSUBG_3061 [Fusarium subglutinans]KAF5610445.1 hypothetical protein FSUBG_3061 [Fusarium subglutinans]
MSSRNFNYTLLAKPIVTLDKIDANTKYTNDTVVTLRDPIHVLKRTTRNMESTNTLIHDSLSRLERSINRIDSRLRRIEDDMHNKMQNKTQGQDAGTRRCRTCQEKGAGDR